MLNCKRCKSNFRYSEEFLNKISIPGQEVSPPQLCPECRRQRRLSFRNERTYYKRKCDLTGQNIISIYSPDSGLTVYEHKAWYADQWNALDYGVDYDPQRPFFEQFFELQSRVPVFSLDVKSNNYNCDYCNLISESKDCYQVVACTAGEECLYSAFLQRNRNVIDCFFIFDSELCYECVDCYACYNLQYSNFCHNCIDSYYLHDCRATKECFACVGLNQAKYQILNQQYSKEEYQIKVKEILNNKVLLAKVLSAWNELKENIPAKYYAGFQNENFSGDHLHYCKNAFNCFDCTYLEDCENCVWFHKSTDCQDCYGWGLGGELGYESHLVGHNFSRLRFCDSCWNGVSNLTYCRLCLDNSRDLFGCISLRGKQYCVLNKQYSKSEYEKLVSRIISDMKKRGEWGEFFPTKYSPFAYNETVANEYYPLTKHQALVSGYKWKDKLPYTTGLETIRDFANQVDDSILEHVLACQICERNYRINELELKLYKKMNLKIPDYCFHCRHMSRQLQRNPRKLNRIRCDQCNTELISAQQSNKIICEKCYLNT